MSKELIVDTLRTIRKTAAKFLTLFSIVAIGVAFFVGVCASAPIMSYSVDKYNDEYDLMDFQLYATFGFDEDDIRAIQNVDGVQTVAGNKFVDAIGHVDNRDTVVRIESYKPNQEVNNFVLVDGRMPENANECLAESGGRLFQGLEIGTTIEISRPENDLSDFTDVTKLKIVGLVRTPEYLNEEKGNSTLSNRAIQTYFFVPESTFNNDFYTSVLITVKGAKDYNSFSNKYFDYVAPIEANLETLSKTQQQVRRDKIVAEATEKYNDGLKEYEDGKKEFEDEIAKAEKEIADARKKIKDGEQEIIDNEIKLETETTNAKAELDKAQADLEAGLVQWRTEKNNFDTVTKPGLISQRTDLENKLSPLLTAKTGLDQVNVALSSLNQNKVELEAYLATLNPSDPAYTETANQILLVEQGIAQAEANKNIILTELAKYSLDESTLGPTIDQLQSGISQITAGITEGESKLAAAKTQLDSGFTQVYNGQVELETTKADALTKIADAKVELANGKKELAENLVTFEDEKEKGQKELDDANRDLVKAKEDIDAIGEAEWTILNREKNYSSKTYSDTITQMEAIASIFPVFFFLVAALVCLTTMTRMVDEQRGQIGVLRALGYNKLACASKYLIYAIVATLLGGIVGTVIGLLIFPSVVYSAWGMMYVLPPIKMIIPWDLILLSNTLFIVVMALTTWLACRQAMNEVPSQLLRPKAPAMGKKILLERIPFIWKRFSFTSKVTARNIIRYKKRFFMTVLGIAGCTALLVAGFGIKGSISTIVDRQFKGIYLYDGSVTLSDDLTQSQIAKIDNQIKEMSNIEASLALTEYTSKVIANGVEQTAIVSIYQNNAEMSEMNNIQHRKNKNEVILDDSGVIINEKLAELLNIGVGDTIQIESENGIMKNFTVTDLCEWYVNHAVFMTKAAYENAFTIKPVINSIQIKMIEDTPELQQNISKIDGVESLNFYGGIIDNFNQMINGLDIVVVVLIVSAGLLAFVVLSNLTNVNISERQREIATLKVLGFNRKEVNAYIYKENFILTFIGSLVGLLLGVILHRFIILMVEMDYVMFGRDVGVMGLLYSVALTMFFALLVNMAMTFKLRKIQMVESLKSVE
ncbi:MAG: FtsX-like permease family protein [Anaerorhabdus sp.]|uniref:FtsX-like permease family protein n=1 Tax=Anaerorhabdus sp. TaxID=1872524 RepID=UPI002FCABFCA